MCRNYMIFHIHLFRMYVYAHYGCGGFCTFHSVCPPPPNARAWRSEKCSGQRAYVDNISCEAMQMSSAAANGRRGGHFESGWRWWKCRLLKSEFEISFENIHTSLGCLITPTQNGTIRGAPSTRSAIAAHSIIMYLLMWKGCYVCSSSYSTYDSWHTFRYIIILKDFFRLFFIFIFHHFSWKWAKAQNAKFYEMFSTNFYWN